MILNFHFSDNWFKYGYRAYVGVLNTMCYEQLPLVLVYTYALWHDATKASFILEGLKLCFHYFFDFQPSILIPLIFNHLNLKALKALPTT